MRFSRTLAVPAPRVRAEREPAPAAIPHPPLVDSADSANGIAFFVTLALIFVIESRVSDLIAFELGGATYLAKIFFVAGLALVVMTGGWRRAVSNRPAILLLLLTCLFLVDVPFSVWKGGSVHLLMEWWIKALAFFLIIAGSLVTVRHCRQAIYAIGLSGALIVVQSRFVAADSSQRLQLDAGSLGNPNDLAFALILSIPCCILIVLRARGAFMRIGGGVLTALLLVSALQTGSRGGLIVLGVVLAFIFFTSPVAIRLIEVGGVVVLIVVSFALAPENVLDRYRVLVSDAAGENGKVSWEAAAAVGSSESRKELLKRSLILTLQHPLVGVGPGMFPVAVADEHKVTADPTDDGVAWRETHNSYTQISSECGLPALALFLGVLAYALRANFRMVRKFRNHPEFADAHACAYCLLLALVAYAVNAMFMSIGYGFALPMLAAFTACLERASAASMRALSLRHAG